MCVSIKIPFAAWQGKEFIDIDFPSNWQVNVAQPEDAPAITDLQILKQLQTPIDSESLQELASGKRTVAIAVDDITRPTPVARILPYVLEILLNAGIEKQNIKIIIATGAHRPMDESEMIKKLSLEIYKSYDCIVHDFMGEDIQKVGWVDSGPVYINRHFLNADLKLCLGGVMPHGETGFGGASKLVVPGVAGYISIAYLHGALPPRLTGEIEGSKDRREWIEKVAHYIGVDAVICAVVNTKREIAGLFFGDLIQAHRKACQLACDIGKTKLTSEISQDVDILILNTYPLDTDPVQMGKVLWISGEIKAEDVVLVNSASDGIFYHGMGMGSGVNWTRLLSNLPSWLYSPSKIATWLKVILKTIKNPALTARYCYFAFNNMHYSKYDQYKKKLSKKKIYSDKEQGLYVFSSNFPYWGLKNRYPHAVLYRNWDEMIDKLKQKYPAKAKILLFPCTPIQLIESQ